MGHGGRISVSPAAGGGTIFQLELPVSTRAMADTDWQSEIAKASLRIPCVRRPDAHALPDEQRSGSPHHGGANQDAEEPVDRDVEHFGQLAADERAGHSDQDVGENRRDGIRVIIPAIQPRGRR